MLSYNGDWMTAIFDKYNNLIFFFVKRLNYQNNVHLIFQIVDINYV